MVPVACMVAWSGGSRSSTAIRNQHSTSRPGCSNKYTAVSRPCPITRQGATRAGPTHQYTNPPQKGHGRWQQHSWARRRGNDKFITTAATFSAPPVMKLSPLPPCPQVILLQLAMLGARFSEMTPVKGYKGQWYDVSAYKNGEAIIRIQGQASGSFAPIIKHSRIPGGVQSRSARS